mmetsp:Transcript_18585/g.38677  ORF Transcript_18585/g.38677 Transcript_18585/m.38677 type:complete len:216 (+) Transcript_18585:20-667(+)
MHSTSWSSASNKAASIARRYACRSSLTRSFSGLKNHHGARTGPIPFGFQRKASVTKTLKPSSCDHTSRRIKRLGPIYAIESTDMAFTGMGNSLDRETVRDFSHESSRRIDRNTMDGGYKFDTSSSGGRILDSLMRGLGAAKHASQSGGVQSTFLSTRTMFRQFSSGGGKGEGESEGSEVVEGGNSTNDDKNDGVEVGLGNVEEEEEEEEWSSWSP